jgi:hypothetical protein
MAKPAKLVKVNVGDYNHQTAQSAQVDFFTAINSAGGTDAVAVGQTSKVVTHGLTDAITGAAATPSRVMVTPTNDPQQRFWVSAKSSTTFTVTTAGAIASTNFNFDFRAYAAD